MAASSGNTLFNSSSYSAACAFSRFDAYKKACIFYIYKFAHGNNIDGFLHEHGSNRSYEPTWSLALNNDIPLFIAD
jgi:hypothetical protein